MRGFDPTLKASEQARGDFVSAGMSYGSALVICAMTGLKNLFKKCGSFSINY
jgi:hypothetical protein